MRYRCIDVRIWGDEKFRTLSPLSPSGQALFIYLLTNINTNSIPGLYRAGLAAMAEELRWSLEDFQGALNELQQEGLVKTDLNARVVFIPNVIKYNKPESPNVIKSWSLHWDEVPECALKNEAYDFLKVYIKGMGEPFLKALNETINEFSKKAIPKALRKASLNQEQEQDQEQEINTAFGSTEPIQGKYIIKKRSNFGGKASSDVMAQMDNLADGAI